jgi:hypothetical protein
VTARRMLHLVVVVSDGRRMLATCHSDTPISQLTSQLESELAATFHTTDRLQHLSKVVDTNLGSTDVDGRACDPPNYALSAAAMIGDLVADGDTVFAVVDTLNEEAKVASMRSAAAQVPEPKLSTVAECEARWEEIGRAAERGRQHVAARLREVGPSAPQALLDEAGRRLLGALARSPDASVQGVACDCLAAATAIPRLAGFSAVEVLTEVERALSTRTTNNIENEDTGKAPTVAGILLGMCEATAAPSVRVAAEAVLQHLQAEARAERARNSHGDIGFDRAVYQLGERQAEPSRDRESSEPTSLHEPERTAKIQGRDGSSLLGDLLGGTPSSRISALKALALLALQEDQRWHLLRCQGLVATLVTLAGGNAVGDGEGVLVDGPPELQRLAAKALAHLGTTEAIRDKLLLHRGLSELISRPPVGLDESAVCYLQMLMPRAE